MIHACTAAHCGCRCGACAGCDCACHALDNIAPPLQLEQVAAWWYEQASPTHEHMLGLSIWNYDGPGGWGAIAPEGGNATRSWWAVVNQA